jgi:hypothetical protein
MDDPREMERRVDAVKGTWRGLRVRPRAEKARLPGKPAPAPGPHNMNLLMLHRAADRINKQRESLPDGIELQVVRNISRFTLELVRTGDKAVVHRSRDLPLATMSYSSVNAVIRSFLNNESLKKFDIY